jgi:hypothetical protein
MKRSACLIILALLLMVRSGIAENVTLDEVLRKTVDKNPEIQSAKLRLEAAYGRRLARSLPDAPGVVGGDRGDMRRMETESTVWLANGFYQPLSIAAIPASFCVEMFGFNRAATTQHGGG